MLVPIRISFPTESTIGTSDDSYEPTQVGPLWSMLVGPVLRLQRPMSKGARGIRFQLMPGLFVRHEQISPWAGDLVRCPREVERIVIVRLDDLLDPARRRMRRREITGVAIDIPFFDVGDLFLWGATAMALSELVERLRAVG